MTIGIFSLTLIPNSAYAQVSCPDCEIGDPRLTNIDINASTQNNSYENGDRVVVSGSITNFDYSEHSDIALTYRVLDTTGNILTVGQTLPNPKGIFSFDFLVGGSLYKETGNYSIQLIFGSVTDEISFRYSGGEFEPSLPGTSIPSPDPHSSSDAIIVVTIEGDHVFYLDSPNAIIRGSVKIFDFSPSDGIYFMKVTHIPTFKVLKDFEIYPKFLGDDVWGTQIAYSILDTDIQYGGQTLYGEFEIEVTSEFGGLVGRESFFIFESQESDDTPQPKVPEWVKSNAEWWADGLIDDHTFVSGIQYLIKEKILNVSVTPTQSSGSSEVPDWVKSNADWWARDLISEEEFLRAIEYLVKNSIIDVSEKSPNTLLYDDQDVMEQYEEGLISESQFEQKLSELGYTSEEIRQAKALTGKLEHQEGYQNPFISLRTDDNHYDEGDTIVVSGQVLRVLDDTTIILQTWFDGNMIDISQFFPARDGSYSHTMIPEPKKEILETRDSFEVQIPGGGTFDVEYAIRDGTLKDMILIPDDYTLEILIDAPDEGSISLKLPREAIDAKNQNGQDEVFIILFDNIQSPYEETETNSQSRVITLRFEEGDSYIEIIGNKVIGNVVDSTPYGNSGISSNSVFSIIPAKPNVGSSFRVTGDNFGASQEFGFLLNSQKLGSFSTDSVGHFVSTFEIPNTQNAERVNFIVRDSTGEEINISVRLGDEGVRVY
jgi:hypothetical protein